MVSFHRSSLPFRPRGSEVLPCTLARVPSPYPRRVLAWLHLATCHTTTISSLLPCHIKHNNIHVSCLDLRGWGWGRGIISPSPRVVLEVKVTELGPRVVGLVPRRESALSMRVGRCKGKSSGGMPDQAMETYATIIKRVWKHHLSTFSATGKNGEVLSFLFSVWWNATDSFVYL